MPSKLLLADDSVTIQRVIELTFEDEDVEVTSVGDGQQAIDRLERERPDIVLVDATMPERDGYEVAAFIKSTPALADIPVLLLTGAFEPVDDARARAARVDGVLSKPFETDTVIKRVRELLLGKRSSRESPRPFEGFGRIVEGAPLDDGPPLASPRVESPAAAGEALEDEFFDRLDEAFGTAPSPGADDGAAGQGPAGGTSGLEAGDDSLTWELPPEVVQQTSAPSPAAAAVEAPAAPAPPPVPPPVPAEAPPPLADAFAALLAAEQAQVRAPEPAPAAEDAVGPVVERVTRRVLEQLDEGSLRELVLQHVAGIAEGLVRQELERKKSGR